MRVSIIGCGLVGVKRAKALLDSRLVACADLVPERSERLAAMIPGVDHSSDWRRAVDRKDVDLVIVSTTHNALAEITLAAITAGKHVLVEKPAARRAEEIQCLYEPAKRAKVHVRVGFNHRYHPAVRKARELFKSNAVGEIMYLRARYGHGGRVGYEREWRANPALSGGGELIDQGVHLIDLARWFLGDFTEVQGWAHTYFWDMPVEDNGFMILKTPRQQVAFLHASCTEWKNLFSLEIFGRQGKLDISGLGGSYGTERLTYHRMLPEMGPPETTVWEYPATDNSWEVEFSEFMEDIRLGRQPEASLNDAQAALRIIERVYQASGL